MHYIFFHVSGIALLEIVFYFYYIGPIETELFKNSIENIVRPYTAYENPDSESKPEPIIVIIPYYKNWTNLNFTIHYQNDYLVNILEENAIKEDGERWDLNYELFLETIYKWFLFTLASILYYILFHLRYFSKAKDICHKRFQLNTNNIEMNHVHNSEESIEIDDYRLTYSTSKSSFDIEANKGAISDNTKPISNINGEIKTKYIFMFCHYIVLGGSILLFQYLFFQYVVLNYNVISLEELEYLLYKDFYPFLENYLDYTN